VQLVARYEKPPCCGRTAIQYLSTGNEPMVPTAKSRNAVSMLPDSFYLNASFGAIIGAVDRDLGRELDAQIEGSHAEPYILYDLASR
jgi:hypothetical protein